MLVLALGGWAQAAPFTVTDDFSRYPAESDGSPAWTTGGIDWSINAKNFVCQEKGRDNALVTTAPSGKQVVVQANLILRNTTNTGWKIAGLLIQQDARNYWHLAFCESPDGDGKHHFVELTEMLDGGWLAQFQPATKLNQTSSTGSDFNWKYDHPYRLRLELTPAGIAGTVAELDGALCTELRYTFTTRAVTSGQPGLDVGGMHTEFSSFSTTVAQPTPPPAKVGRPPYISHGYAAITSKATGFFYTEKRGDIWWMIDPTGKATLAYGADHVNYNAHWCEKLGYAPYHRNVELQYGNEEKWAATAVDRLSAWGFTSLGVGTSPGVRYRNLPHYELLGMGTEFTAYDSITPRTTWTGFPNVFSPRFALFCEKMARQRCAPYIDDPWLVGYFIDNELEWSAWTGGGLVVDTMKQPAENSAKRVLITLFKERHATVADFNATWGAALVHWDDLPALTVLPRAVTPAAVEDERLFTRLVAERYFAVTSAAIRKADPHHMVMGCRFAGWVPDVLDIAGKYCDVHSVNCYRKLDLHTGALVDGYPAELEGWYAKSNKPFIITEWSFPALDVGLPCLHGAGQRVPTQADRAFAFTAFQKFLITTPYVVGSNFFMWADEPALGISSVFPEDSNYGLVNEHDAPYQLLTDAATKLHAVAYDLHNRHTADFSVQPLPHGTFTVKNNGGAAGACTVTQWADGVRLQQTAITLEAGAVRDFTIPGTILAKPGGHFLVCQAAPTNPLLVRDPQHTWATQTCYTPGVPWATGTMARVPVLVSNPTPVAQAQVVIETPVPVFPGDGKRSPIAMRAVGTDGAPTPCQLDTLPDGPVVAVQVGDLPPWGCRTIFLTPGTPADITPAVAYLEKDGGFTANNGVLTLAHLNADSPNIFDRIALNGVEMGKFHPVLWQFTDQNAWVSPTTIQGVRVHTGPVRLVLEVTTAFTAANLQAPNRLSNFQMQYRIIIEPNRPWFSSRLLWLANIDTQALKMNGYYHYLISNIAGDALHDEAHETFWSNTAAGYNLGIVADSPSVTVNYWKDNQGNEHPDALRTLKLTLQPGERYTHREPLAYILAGTTKEWPGLLRTREFSSALASLPFAVETK